MHQDHDALDLTDNDISQLANFPLSPRLRTLLLARNRVAALHPTLSAALPGLTTLVLQANRLAELADLDPLAGFARLTHLVLAENPVCAKEYYRYWVVHRCPSVRFLDYQKVRLAEREKARELFGTAEEPTPLAQKVSFFHHTLALPFVSLCLPVPPLFSNPHTHAHYTRSQSLLT